MLYDRSWLTHIQASATTNTAVFALKNLDLRRLPFRVMAPPTIQRTTFEEDRRADTRTIMDRITANIEEDTMQLNQIDRRILLADIRISAGNQIAPLFTWVRGYG